MPLTETELDRIRRWCDDQAWQDVSYIVQEAKGGVVLAEVRPGELPLAFARIRRWKGRLELAWQDSHDRWLRWDELPEGADIDVVLAEVADNPDGVFFG